MSKRLLFLMITTAAVSLQGCGGGPGGGRGAPPDGMMGGPMMGPGGNDTSVERMLQLQRFDADADGKITRDEFGKVVAADYAGADVNRDGRIGSEEAISFNSRQAKPDASGAVRDVSPIIDWNADGNIAVDEFSAQWRTLFERADADRDGVVTAEELSRPQRGPGGGRPPGGPGGPGGPSGQGGGRSGPSSGRPGGGF